MDEEGQLNAGIMSKFLDKLDIDVDDKSDELYIIVKDKELLTGIVNGSQILLVGGWLKTELPNMEIPVSHFSKLKDAVSTFSGDIKVSLEDRLILKGKNTKKIPLTKWDIKSQKIINKINNDVEGKLPISIQKEEIEILSQDMSIWSKITEVFFKVNNKTLTITMKDETNFESTTEIKDIDLEDGDYILPTIVFKIMKKAENLEVYLSKKFAYFRDKGDQYEVKYLVSTKE